VKPLLLLDVDGPFNPFDNKPHRRPEGFQTFRFSVAGMHPHRTLRVWLRPEHGPQLCRLAERTGCELVWATSWQHEANEFIGPQLGLPTLPVITFPEFNPVQGWPRGAWKWNAVADYAGDRPIAWLDDQLDDREFASAQAAFLARRGTAPTLLHRVSARTGITDADLAAVEAFAHEHWQMP